MHVFGVNTGGICKYQPKKYYSETLTKKKNQRKTEKETIYHAKEKEKETCTAH